jgi:hypothetical protein
VNLSLYSATDTPLLEREELLLLDLHDSRRYVVALEVGGELVSGDSVWGGMSSSICVPTSGCRPLKSSCNIQDLLSVITLTGSKHLQHCLQLILSFKRISGISEHRGVVTHELPVLVAGRWLLHRWVVDLGLQIRHSVGQVLEELSVRLQELLHGGIHLCLPRCSSGTIHCRLIDS